LQCTYIYVCKAPNRWTSVSEIVSFCFFESRRHTWVDWECSKSIESWVRYFFTVFLT
jgi:hypothetical protein